MVYIPNLGQIIPVFGGYIAFGLCIWDDFCELNNDKNLISEFLDQIYYSFRFYASFEKINFKTYGQTFIAYNYVQKTVSEKSQLERCF